MQTRSPQISSEPDCFVFLKQIFCSACLIGMDGNPDLFMDNLVVKALGSTKLSGTLEGWIND